MPKDDQIRVRLTSDEKAVIKKYADLSEMDMGPYLLRVALLKKVVFGTTEGVFQERPAGRIVIEQHSPENAEQKAFRGHKPPRQPHQTA